MLSENSMHTDAHLEGLLRPLFIAHDTIEDDDMDFVDIHKDHLSYLT